MRLLGPLLPGALTLTLLAAGAGCAAPAGPSALAGAAPAPGSAVVAPPQETAAACAAPAPAGAPVPVVQSGLHGYGQVVAYSADGALVAVGDQGNAIRLFDPHTGALRGLLRGHERPVNGLAFSPAGDTLVSTGLDQTARRWDLRTGKSASMGVLPSRPHAVSWSPDGKHLATRHESVIRLWTSDGQPLKDLLAPGAGHSWSPDGRAIVTWGRRSGASVEVAIWDANTGALHFRAPAAKATTAAAWSPDSKTLAWVQDETVTFADARTFAVRGKLVATGAFAGSFAWSPSGKRLAVGDKADAVQIWDPVARVQVARVDRVSHEVFAWSPDGALLAVGAGHNVELRDGLTAAPRKLLVGVLERVWPLAWSPDSKVLAGASGIGDPDMLFWDVASGARRAAPKQQYRARRFAWSPDGKALVSLGSPGLGADRENAARVWDGATGALRATLSDPAGERLSLDGHHGVAWSPDGARIALAGMETVALWDANRAQRLAILDEDRGYRSEHALAFAPGGETLATSGGAQAEIRLWSSATGARTGTVQTGLSHVWSLSWSRDGGVLAAGGNGQIKLFDTRTWLELRELTGSFRGALEMVFSPDGRRLFVAGENGKVTVYDPTTTSQIATIDAHKSRVRSLALSPDGAGLATAGEDRTVKIWELAGYHLVGEVPALDEDGAEQVAFSPDGEVLAAARGALQLYRLRDGALASLRPVAVSGVLHGLVVSEDGLFSGDAAALDALRFRDAGDVRRAPLRSAAEVADRLFRPTLLASFLAGCPMKAP